MKSGVDQGGLLLLDRIKAVSKYWPVENAYAVFGRGGKCSTCLLGRVASK